MTDFANLFEPHRSLLRLHCYRMLGSSCDSEDMVQETFTRAFRSRHTLQDEAVARAWLHRIATNVCLDELDKRLPRVRGTETPAGDPDLPSPAATGEDAWIEPCPGAWTATQVRDPAAEYTIKESVALAFVAALQVLTPAQRAVLLLRDVVGLSAAETAEALESTVPAANSTLHRARAALEERVGPRASWSPEVAEPIDQALLDRYMRAWQSGDFDTIVALLHEEVTLSMPPVPLWISGRSAVTRFFERRVMAALEARVFRALLTEANGRPAVAFYRQSGGAVAALYAVHALQVKDGRVAIIDHFMGARAQAAFIAAGLPSSLPPADP